MVSILLSKFRHFFSQIAGAKIASQVEKVVLVCKPEMVLWIKVVPLLGMPIIKRILLED